MAIYNASENTLGNTEYNSHYSSVELECIDHYNSVINNDWDNITFISNCTKEYYRARPFIRSNNGTTSFTYEINIVAKVAGEHRLTFYGVTTIINSSRATSERNPARYGNANSTITLPNKSTITEQWLSPSKVVETPQFRDLGIHWLKKGSNIFKITTSAKGLTGNIVAHKIRTYEGNSSGRGNLFYDKIDFTDNSIEDTNSGTLHTYQIKQDDKFGGYIDSSSNSYLVFDMKDTINIYGGSTLNDNKQLFGGYLTQPADRDDLKDTNKIGFMDRWEDATNVTIPKSIIIDGEPINESEETVQCTDIYNAIQYLLDCLEKPINYTNFNKYIIPLQQKTNYYIYDPAKSNKDDDASNSSAKLLKTAQSTLEKKLEKIDKWYESEKKKIDLKYDKEKDTVELRYAKDRAKAQKVLCSKSTGVASAKAFKTVEEKISKIEGKKGLGVTEKAFIELCKKYGGTKAIPSNLLTNAQKKFMSKYDDYNSYFKKYYLVSECRSKAQAVVEEKVKNNKTLQKIEEKRKEETEALDLKRDKKIATVETDYANTFGGKVEKNFEWMRLTTTKNKKWTQLQNDPLKGAAKYAKFANEITQYAIIWERTYDTKRNTDVTITKDHGIVEIIYAFSQNWVDKYKKDKKYDKPFQAYLKIDYTIQGNSQIQTAYVNFTAESKKTPLIPQEEFYDKLHYDVGKENKFELDLYSYIKQRHGGTDKTFILKRITFENVTDPPEPNDQGITKLSEDFDIEKEPNARKILIGTITIRGGKIAIDELIECRGEYVLTTLRKLLERTNLSMYIKPAKERRNDLLIVEEKESITQPIVYEEGINIVDGITSCDYSPKGKIKNSIVKTYKNSNTNKEVARHAIDLNSIYHYGTMEDYEDTKYVASSNGFIDYQARQDLDSKPPNYAQSLSVKGCDDVRVDRLIEIKAKRKHVSGYRTVKSIKRKFSGETSPQWITELGIEEKTLATRVEATRAKYK